MLCLWKDKTNVLGMSREERKREGGGEAKISEAQKNVEAQVVEGGKNLMMRKVILKPEKKIED